MTAAQQPLAGSRVLIPRGGEFGDRLAAAVSHHGGEPVIAPIIEFRHPVDADRLREECDRLSAGSYDWVAVTSATTVEVLVRQGVTIPLTTRVAVVGPATGNAAEAAGFRVDFMPESTFSAAAMIAEWPEVASTTSATTAAPGSVLLPQSAIAEPTLADGLAARGYAVTTVSAYETVVVHWNESIRRQAAAGDFAAVLLTSTSVARAVADEKILPNSTLIVCIGESTAVGARAARLPVHAVAETSTADGLVAALITQLSSPRTEVSL